MHLGEDSALQALEIFVHSADCPRWVKKRFEYHNRERQARAPRRREAVVVEEREAEEAPAEEVSDSRKAMLEKVQAHGLAWASTGSSCPFTVKEALLASRTTPRVQTLRELLTALGVKAPLPKTKAALVEEVVLHLLALDLIPFTKRGTGMVKK